jgi:hypothetical protein
VLYVRVTDSEFLRYQDLCERHGARNMSDLVRCAVEAMNGTRQTSFETEVTERLQQLEASLASLRGTMERITEGKSA